MNTSQHQSAFETIQWTTMASDKPVSIIETYQLKMPALVLLALRHGSSKLEMKYYVQCW